MRVVAGPSAPSLGRACTPPRLVFPATHCAAQAGGGVPQPGSGSWRQRVRARGAGVSARNKGISPGFLPSRSIACGALSSPATPCDSRAPLRDFRTRVARDAMPAQHEAEASAAPGPAAHGQQQAPILIFTTDACRYCREAKAVLQGAGHGAQYAEFKVGVGQQQAPAIRAALAQASGRRTVPVIYANGTLVGGCDELKQAVSSGQLATLLSSAPQPLPPPIQALLDQPDPPASPSSPGTGGPPAGLSPTAGLPAQRMEEVLAVYGRMADVASGVSRQDLTQWGGLPFGLGHSERRVFEGAQAQEWLTKNEPQLCPDAASALQMGRDLERLSLLHHVHCAEPFSGAPDVYFRLLCDEAPVSPALNARVPWLRPARPASVVAEELRLRILSMYEEALSLDGKGVDYTKLTGSPSYTAYEAATEELQKVDVLAMSRAEQKAFWLNIYNSLIIHGLVAKGPPPSFLQRMSFYGSTSYRVSGLDLSLNDIEHGVLRGNRPSPTGLGGKPCFGAEDQRRYMALPPNDARIHFALNCGAKSCPPVRLFSADGLEEQLDSATSAFLGDDVSIDVEQGTVELTKLLQWYGVDFGKVEHERLAWMARYLDGEKKAQAEALLKKGSIKFNFRKYDWSLNGM